MSRNVGTPGDGDLYLVFASVTGQSSGGALSDDRSLGWTEVARSVKNSSADVLMCFVANNFAAAAPGNLTVTFTPAGAPTCTGNIIGAAKITGMLRVGALAVRQTAKEDNKTVSAPASPTFASAPLTTNGVFAAVFHSALVAPTRPTGWSSGTGGSYGTPNTGLAPNHIASGFTNTNVTWVGNATQPYCSLAVELDVTAPPAATVHSPVPALAAGCGNV